MKKEHREVVKELSDYIFWAFGNRKESFIVDDASYGEQMSIVVSGIMSGLANVLIILAMTTENEKAIEEMHKFIVKLLKSVPDSECDIVDMKKH